MTNSEQKMKKYLKAVNRRLNLPSDVKKRVMTDFTSSIKSRKDAGKTDEEIYAELGTPAAIAADLNEQMKEFAYSKSPWRWVCFAIIVLCALILLHGGLRGLLAAALTYSEKAGIGIIGGADVPTAVIVGQNTLVFEIFVFMLQDRSYRYICHIHYTFPYRYTLFRNPQIV